MKHTSIRIRDYRDSDYQQICEIWVELDLGNPARGDNQTIIAKTLQAGGKFLVIEEMLTGKIFGTSWITNDGRRLYLHHFGIALTHQNKGFGDLLAKASIQYARDLNMQIKLEVAPKNIAAVRLYEKNGFKLLGDYVVYIIRSHNI